MGLNFHRNFVRSILLGTGEEGGQGTMSVMLVPSAPRERMWRGTYISDVRPRRSNGENGERDLY